MKKFLFFLLAFGIGIGVFAQVRPHFLNGGNKNFKAPTRGMAIDNTVVGLQSFNPIVTPKSVLDDPSTMVSTYDEQTNAAIAPRAYLYPDGTIAAVCTWSASTSSAFADRGTGYNYYAPGSAGNGWMAQPTSRIETGIRTGWPSYAPFGANGEIVIAHNVTAGVALIMSTRTTKGTGTWNVTQPAGLVPPSGATVMAWPRMVTNGTNRNNIHIIALTEPTANGGVVYQGLDGALLYNRSTDGGVTWIGWQLLPGMTSAQYLGFGGDDYAWAEPKGDTLCFIAGAGVSQWNDEFIMKSTDNGTTWTKTKIWTCPYDLWPGTTATDTFYIPDGGCAAAIDKNGKVHVAFGRQRAIGDATGAKSYFPFTDGLIYWHEGMAPLPQSLDVDSIFVGWVKDDLSLMTLTNLAFYQNSLSAWPQIVTDENNYVFVIWASVTSLLDPDNYMLRHLYARASIDGGVTWRDSLVELTSNFFQYHWEECVYPCASPTSTDSLYILFQGDLSAGNYLTDSQPNMQGQTLIDNNDMYFIKPSKFDIEVLDGIDQKKSQPVMMVSQNIPNPFMNQTKVNVTLSKKGTLSLEVYSLVGQKVAEINKGIVNPGNYQFVLDASQFTQGIYFYTVKCNNESSTRKMIVE